MDWLRRLEESSLSVEDIMQNGSEIVDILNNDQEAKQFPTEGNISICKFFFLCVA